MVESPMNITVEDVAPGKKRLKVEVPANRVQQAYDRVADDFQKQARIPGFRPGHAPRAVVVAGEDENGHYRIRRDHRACATAAG